LTTADSQEKLKEEARAMRARIEGLLKDTTDPRQRMIRSVCIYAGLITETLIEFDEPDVVMEQAFHRIADLLRCDPDDDPNENALLPIAYDIDHDTELGRQVGRVVAEKLPKGLDDIHEIAIALVINDFPVWEKEGTPRDKLLRLLVETVIASLTYEMATQDFCDLLIEEFIADDGHTPGEGIFALAAAAGYYMTLAENKMVLPDDADQHITNVMVRESIRHGTPGSKNWISLTPANDGEDKKVPVFLEILNPKIEEFFVLIGLDDPVGRAVAIAKAVGRMVAVISVEDIGQIHPSIAKSLAKTGMILGSRYKEKAFA